MIEFLYLDEIDCSMIIFREKSLQKVKGEIVEMLFKRNVLWFTPKGPKSGGKNLITKFTRECLRVLLCFAVFIPLMPGAMKLGNKKSCNSISFF